MFVFIFMFLLISAYWDSYLNKQIFVYLSSIILIVLAAFRGLNVGNDTLIYFQSYERLPTIINTNFELGYSTLEHIFFSCGLPWVVFSFVIAFCTIGLITLNYASFAKYTGFALLYYYSRFYINRDFTQIRASLAAAILLCSFKYLYQRKLWKFLIVILIASSFHLGALIGIILYPLFLILNHNDKIFRYYIIAIGLSAIMSFLLKNVLININYSRISSYLTNPTYVNNGNGLLNPVIIFQIIVSCTAMYLYSKNKYQKSKYYFVLLLSYSISTILLILLSQFYTLAGRTSTFLVTVEPIIILNICFSLSNNPFLAKCYFSGISMIIFWLINFSTGIIPNLNYNFFR